MTTSFSIRNQSKKEQLQHPSPASFSVVSHRFLGCRRGKYSRLQTWSLLPCLSLWYNPVLQGPTASELRYHACRCVQPNAAGSHSLRTQRLRDWIFWLSYLKLPKVFPTSPPPAPLQILPLPCLLPRWQIWSKIPGTGEQGGRISLGFLLRRSWWNLAPDAAQSLLSAGQCSQWESEQEPFPESGTNLEQRPLQCWNMKHINLILVAALNLGCHLVLKLW